jgi:hypothetical protein
MMVLVGLVSPAGGWAACSCREPEKPELPADRADSRDMDRAQQEIVRYVEQMKGYRSCLAKCLTDAEADLAGYVEGWNYTVERFNTRGK